MAQPSLHCPHQISSVGRVDEDNVASAIVKVWMQTVWLNVTLQFILKMDLDKLQLVDYVHLQS